MRVLLFALIGLAAAASAQADPMTATAGTETVLYGAGSKPTDDELRLILFGDRNGIPLETRGIVMRETAPPTAPAAPTPRLAAEVAPVVSAATATPAAYVAPPAPEAHSVAFNIEFGFDSANLPTAAYDHLATLAAALKSPAAEGHRVLIVGHTDLVGAEDYNDSLSMRRAAATRAALISQFGVPESRLMAVGVGMTQPLMGVPGDAPQNRRVEFQTMP